MAGELIQDIIPRHDARGTLLDAVQEEKARGEWELSKVDNRLAIKALFDRGVKLSDIWAVYYELECASDSHSDQVFGNDEQGQHGAPRIVVEDVYLLGLDGEPRVETF